MKVVYWKPSWEEQQDGYDVIGGDVELETEERLLIKSSHGQFIVDSRNDDLNVFASSGGIRTWLFSMKAGVTRKHGDERHPTQEP